MTAESGEDLSYDQIVALDDDAIVSLLAGNELPESNEATEEEASADSKEVEGVLAKDGVNIIPFSVLDATRKNLTAAEQRALSAEQRAEELAKSLEDLKTNTQDVLISEDEIEVLTEELPEVAASIRALQAKVKAQELDLGKVQKEKELNEQELAAQTVQNAIDSNPKLLYLQTHDKEAWNKAVKIDAVLRGDPDFEGLSFSERFAEVVERYEMAYGKIGIAPSKADVKEAANKVLKSASSKPPTTLSDIPDGSIPPSDEFSHLLEKDGASIAEALSRMTPRQQEEFLAKVKF